MRERWHGGGDPEALTGALIAAHSWGASVEGGALRHRVILVIRHAHIVTGNNRALTEALENTAQCLKPPP